MLDAQLVLNYNNKTTINKKLLVKSTVVAWPHSQALTSHLLTLPFHRDGGEAGGQQEMLKYRQGCYQLLMHTNHAQLQVT